MTIVIFIYHQLSAYDIIVNCSGVGANTLVPDLSVTPGRGQAIRVGLTLHSNINKYMLLYFTRMELIY